ncbi:MAG: kelch repeat-containing protein, partial [Polyangiales bacterium]
MRALAIGAAFCAVSCSVEAPTTRATTELVRGDDPDVAWIDEGDGFRAKGIEKVPPLHPAGAETLRAHAPKLANGPIVLARASGAMVLHAIGARAVQGTVVAGTITYADAWPGVDLVLLAKKGLIEDLRVVRRPEGLAHLSTAIDGLPPRISNGAIVVGNLFRAEAPTAIDARGAALPVKAVVEGNVLSLSVPASAFPIVVDPAWMAASTLVTPRDRTAGAALSDGTVMAIGGTSNGFDTLASTEIFDAKAAAWSPGPSLAHARKSHAAVVLSDGKVLVVGGDPIAEVFDPTAKTWSDAGTGALRSDPAAVRLSSGDVLVVGGRNGAELSTAEIWSATTHTFRAVASMALARVEHTATLMKDGRVLVVGGKKSNVSSATTEVFDPGTETWSAGPSMVSRRHGHSAHLFDDGKVLIVGGLLDAGEAGYEDSELFVSGKGFTLTPGGMNRHRGRFGHADLQGNRVIVAGGWDAGVWRGVSCLFDEKSSNWWEPEDIGAGLTGGHQRTASGSLGPYGAVFFGGDEPGGPSDTTDVFHLRAQGEACTPIAGGDHVCEHDCVDLVCCDRPCDGPCEACALTGSVGTCTSIGDGKPVPPRACEDPYLVCIAGACATSCTKDTDCKSPYYCQSGACVSRMTLGSTCTADGQCGSHICADGHCCEERCTSPCDSCNADGACAPAKAGEIPPHDPNACGGYRCGGGGCRITCASD